MNRQKQSKTASVTGSSTGKTFIWLPFTGGISAFAVILPNPTGSLKGLNDDIGARPV
jgi:hypothetical protein